MPDSKYKKPVRVGFFSAIQALKNIFATLSNSPSLFPEMVVGGIPGIKKVYVINHPDLVQHVLQKNPNNYQKGDGYEVLELLLGKGLITNEGESWRKQRTLI